MSKNTHLSVYKIFHCFSLQTMIIFSGLMLWQYITVFSLFIEKKEENLHSNTVNFKKNKQAGNGIVTSRFFKW